MLMTLSCGPKCMSTVKQIKQGKNKHKMYILRTKIELENSVLGPSLVLKERRPLKKCLI